MNIPKSNTDLIRLKCVFSMGTLFLSSSDTLHPFPSLAQERVNPIRKEPEVLNTAFMQGGGFSFWGDYSNLSPSYSNLSPSYALED
jgi:hypothetical protein